MNNMEVLIEELKKLSEKGARFLTINNYTNQKGDLSNYMVIANFSYENAKQKDIEKLNKMKLKDDLKEVARQALLESFEKNKDKTTSSNQSKAQKDTYTNLTSCVRIHNESGRLYLYAKLVGKTIIKEAEKKEVKSDELTKAKNFIKKKLHTSKYRQFIIENISNIRLNNKEIIIDLSK